MRRYAINRNGHARGWYLVAIWHYHATPGFTIKLKRI